MIPMKQLLVSIVATMFMISNNRLLLIAVDNAKIFKEEMQKKNVKNSDALNLSSLRLGINTMMALASSD